LVNLKLISKRKCVYCLKFKYPLVAQLVEQLPFKEMVVGSIPTERTIIKTLIS
jgi:hypothetical protein